MARRAFNIKGVPPSPLFSEAIEAGKTVYLSGQLPLDLISGKLLEGDITVQTEQCFKNLFKVLESAGLTQKDVVKVNVYLTDMSNFEEMNSVYVRQFSPPFPARITLGVASLPLGAQIEIEMIARRK
jgi:2-iminobutanoate/2-iminopropanoate deaminase